VRTTLSGTPDFGSERERYCNIRAS
jgi:hypothetical protein